MATGSYLPSYTLREGEADTSMSAPSRNSQSSNPRRLLFDLHERPPKGNKHPGVSSNFLPENNSSVLRRARRNILRAKTPSISVEGMTKTEFVSAANLRNFLIPRRLYSDIPFRQAARIAPSLASTRAGRHQGFRYGAPDEKTSIGGASYSPTLEYPAVAFPFTNWIRSVTSFPKPRPVIFKSSIPSSARIPSLDS